MVHCYTSQHDTSAGGAIDLNPLVVIIDSEAVLDQHIRTVGQLQSAGLGDKVAAGIMLEP